jgi:predicted nucleic acid-binding protein
MIHLDTNYLIGLLVRGSAEAATVDEWLAEGEPLAASAIAWSEFLNGPVTATEAGQVEAVLQSQITRIPKRSEFGVKAGDFLENNRGVRESVLRLFAFRLHDRQAVFGWAVLAVP